MAKRKTSSRPPSGGGNQGLVITMVFFILATLGLGVATYFGFAGQGKATDDKATAEAEKAKAEKERNWYRFQTRVMKKCLGQPLAPKDDEGLANDWKSYDRKELGGDEALASEKKEFEDLMKSLVENKSANMAWEPQGEGQPRKLNRNYSVGLAELRGEADKAKQDVARLTTQVKALEKDKADLQAEKLALEAAHKEAYDGLKKELKNDVVKQGQVLVTLQAEVTRLSQDKANQELKLAAAEKTKTDALGEADKKLTDQQKVVEALKQTIDKFERPVVEGPKNLRTGWKVLALDRTGDVAYINLGSADKVNTQLRFTVHGVESDGKPIERDKAVVEVVEVKGEHLSRGRILYLDDRLLSGEKRHDRNRNPVLTGDVLVNPSWNPGVPKHVAIAGSVDLTGQGRDNTQEFVNQLKRQNIVVDASVDLRDLTDEKIQEAVNKITVQTDFLVVGDVPVYLKETRDRDGRGKKLQESIDKMKEQAKQNGVRIIGLSKYLELIGYQAPRALDEVDRPLSTTRGPEAKPEPKKDDKPGMEEKK